MTAVLERPSGPAAWSCMPGWGIVGDLTPPELIEARRLRVLRRLIVIALGIVVLLCGAGYGYALVDRSAASDELGKASAQTTLLQVETNKYAGITRIESIVSGIRGQVATAMTGDVDMSHLLSDMRGALPNTMSIQNLTVTINPVGSATGSPTAASSLDTSGHLPIGTVTITGSAQQLDDLSAFVENLSKLRGVVDVIPSSNQVVTGSVQFSITLAVSDRLYTHQFDVSGTSSAPGGN